MTSFKRVLFFCGMTGLALLLAACSLYKPLRVVAPETFGLICVTDGVCVEDPSSINKAVQLRKDALSFIEENIGPIRQAPRVLFCDTKGCFAKFGNPKVAALYIAGLNTLIINDIGWHDYILRHELIHHWQLEQFGTVNFLRMPRWYIEGMAYSLSEDPRYPLPRSDIQEWRDQFNTWVDKGNDWKHAP